MSFIKKIKYYDRSEWPGIALFTLAMKMASYVPRTLRRTHRLIKQLTDEGVEVQKSGKGFGFNYTVWGKSLGFILLRRSSDAMVFDQIILNEEYRPVFKIFQKNSLAFDNMIDAGANIGLTSLYFKARYPASKIIALEPHADTFHRLQEHISLNKLENITALAQGLWSSRTKLAADHNFGDGLDWAFALQEAQDVDAGQIDVLSVADLLNDYGLDKVDLLKIDIEGGEKELFNPSADLSWLDKVVVIALEIHFDDEVRTRILDALKSHGFDISFSGELTIGLNRNFLS